LFALERTQSCLGDNSKEPASAGSFFPNQLRCNSSSVFDPEHDSIKVMTLHVSKGLEFPVVALVGAGRMPAEGEDEREEARLFYVGATRATQRLVIGASGNGKFGQRFPI
jgi:superfamily I DNA/RNA helicase